MRCHRAERLISDELDGALTAKAARRLAAHLAGCPACKAYEARLRVIQAEAAGGKDVPISDAYQVDFSDRLRARLESIEPAAVAGRASRIRRWAWLAAPIAAAALLIFLEVGRRGPGSGQDLVQDEGAFGNISQAVDEDAALAVDLNTLILSSLQDETGTISSEEVPVPTDDPSFWENLSDDEAAAIDQEITKEIKS